MQSLAGTLCRWQVQCVKKCIWGWGWGWSEGFCLIGELALLAKPPLISATPLRSVWLKQKTHTHNEGEESKHMWDMKSTGHTLVDSETRTEFEVCFSYGWGFCSRLCQLSVSSASQGEIKPSPVWKHILNVLIFLSFAFHISHMQYVHSLS